eukprot:5038759-Pleurochrysis_carterae.AAC.1
MASRTLGPARQAPGRHSLTKTGSGTGGHVLRLVHIGDWRGADEGAGTDWSTRRACPLNCVSLLTCRVALDRAS